MTAAIHAGARLGGAAGLALAIALAGCAPEASTEAEAIRPEKSAAALSYSRGSSAESANSDFVALIQASGNSGDEGYYRNVECAAALQGTIEHVEEQISANDPRLAAFGEAIEIFRGRAIALGEQAGYSRRRVLNEISQAHGPEDERDQDTIERQAQQSVLCLYQLS